MPAAERSRFGNKPLVHAYETRRQLAESIEGFAPSAEVQEEIRRRLPEKVA